MYTREQNFCLDVAKLAWERVWSRADAGWKRGRRSSGNTSQSHAVHEEAAVAGAAATGAGPAVGAAVVTPAPPTECAAPGGKLVSTSEPRRGAVSRVMNSVLTGSFADARRRAKGEGGQARGQINRRLRQHAAMRLPRQCGPCRYSPSLATSGRISTGPPISKMTLPTVALAAERRRASNM